MRVCDYCYEQIAEDTRKCPYCGARLNGSANKKRTYEDEDGVTRSEGLFESMFGAHDDDDDHVNRSGDDVCYHTTSSEEDPLNNLRGVFEEKKKEKGNFNGGPHYANTGSSSFESWEEGRSGSRRNYTSTSGNSHSYSTNTGSSNMNDNDKAFLVIATIMLILAPFIGIILFIVYFSKKKHGADSFEKAEKVRKTASGAIIAIFVIIMVITIMMGLIFSMIASETQEVAKGAYDRITSEYEISYPDISTIDTEGLHEFLENYNGRVEQGVVIDSTADAQSDEAEETSVTVNNAALESFLNR